MEENIIEVSWPNLQNTVPGQKFEVRGSVSPNTLVIIDVKVIMGNTPSNGYKMRADASGNFSQTVIVPNEIHAHADETMVTVSASGYKTVSTRYKYSRP